MLLAELALPDISLFQMTAHGGVLFNVVSVFQDVQAAPVLHHVIHVELG